MRKYILLAFVVFFFLAFIFWFTWTKEKEIVQEEKPIKLRQAGFEELPGWQEADLQKSFQAFQKSCKVFLRQNPENTVGSNHINLKVKNWHPACEVAKDLNPKHNAQLKQFFETWFVPFQFIDAHPIEGLFTGYYSPLLKGSLKKSDKYPVPLYSLPSNLIKANLGDFSKDLKHWRIYGRIKGNNLIPYYTRKEINQGAIKKYSKVIVWLDSRVDRQFLEIQGSGIVELENGKRIYLGYSGQNGAKYTSLAQVLIDKGKMTHDNASMQAIRRYIEENPHEKDPILNQNESFVFFHKQKVNAAFGSQCVPLTAGVSLAVDPRWVPYGVPLWLNTTRPGHHSDEEKPMQRLMIAQDTGGAIRGPVRGDVYWGAGKEATFIAGHMKNKGYYWLLLPRTAFN